MRAIATACRCPPDICLTRSRGRVSDFSSLNSVAGTRVHARVVDDRERAEFGARARGRGTRSPPRSDCRTGPGPGRRSRCPGRVHRPACGNAEAVPSRLISPSEGGKLPAMILTSVDLPAPLSPISPSTSPGSIARSIPFSASIAPKCLATPFSSSSANACLPRAGSASCGPACWRGAYTGALRGKGGRCRSAGLT